ncbi:MAG: DUF6088 family protein [Herbaspirillum sp.]
MKKIDAIKMLQQLDKRGVYVFQQRDFAKMFPSEQKKTLEKSLQRLVSDGIVERVAKGVYVNPMAKSKRANIIEDIAIALRPGSFSFVSLESILSEYGVISQVPVSRITIMTTGVKGKYQTPYGTIEFTHTKRGPAEIFKRTMLVKGRPLRIATKEAAIQDLNRVGRNRNMADPQEMLN